MSRHVGTICHEQGEWRVRNELSPSGADRRMWVRCTTRVWALPPSGEIVLPSSSTLVFPPSRFWITVRIYNPAANQIGPDDVVGSGVTVPPVSLSPREVDFLVALCEPEFCEDEQLIRRSIAEIADLFSVSRNTVDTKFRLLRRKLADAHLFDPELIDRQGANDLLARVAADERLINADDLKHADLHGLVRLAEQGPRFC
jgi:hypothetical protein